MNNYIFGMKAEINNDQTSGDFVTKQNMQDGNNNPYNKAFFNKPENMTRSNAEGRITSIPSPYARMHITDLAFQESNCGIGVMTTGQRAQIQLSSDYKRAMSHCLDMFELLYHANEIDLQEKGISLHKIDLLSTRTLDQDERNVLFDEDGKLTNLGRYVETLDLYRDAYMHEIETKNVEDYKFDFKSLYIFKSIVR